MTFSSVSYTHLDVYKRQHHRNARRLDMETQLSIVSPPSPHIIVVCVTVSLGQPVHTYFFWKYLEKDLIFMSLQWATSKPDVRALLLFEIKATEGLIALHWT